MGPTGNTPYGGDDFFASGTPRANPAPGAAPSGVPSGATNQFGAAPTPYAAPAPYGTPAPQYPGAPGWPAPPRKNGIPVWGWLLIVLGGLVGLAIVAAVAIPVFLNTRAQATLDATSVTMPASVAGYTRDTSGAAAQLEQQVLAPMANEPDVAEAKAGVYDGPDGKRAIMLVVKADSPQVGDLQQGVTNSFRGIASSGVQVSAPVPIPPGRLGGEFQCAAAIVKSVRARACVSVDAAAMTQIVVFDPAASDATMLAIRESMEIRS